LSHFTNPYFVLGIFERASHKLLAQSGFGP
jgi:hypothetical protein